MDLSGQQLGNYRLKSILGRGGYATVYLGMHLILQREAAIKVLKEIVLNEEDQAGFHMEARLISKLVHPNIIKVLEAGIEMQKSHGDGSIPYLVMEYAPQGSLRERHPRGTTVAFKQIASYVEQLASALHYAHEKIVLHLDVKPENVLVMSSGNIVLSDFGIAVTGHDSKKPLLKKDDMVEGTALYTAPERYRQIAGRACDQYSLAVVVYEWLTGRCPFPGSVYQIIAEHISMPPPPLYGIYDSITKEINDVVLRALEKDPAARYPSILDFSQALIHALLSVPEEVTIRSPINGQLKPTLPVPPVQITPPQFIPGQVAPSPRPDPVVAPQFAPGQVAPSPRPDPETPPPLAQIRPVQQPITLPSTSTQQAGSYESYTARNPFPEPRFRPRRPPDEDDDKPSVIFKALFFVPLFLAIGNWFGNQFYGEYAKMPKGRFFRQVGMALNFITAILPGILIQPPSAIYIAIGMVWSLGLFWLCIRAVNLAFSGFLGLLVAFYWGILGLVIGTSLSTHLALFNSFLPPWLLGLIFLCASIYLHLRYVLNKRS